jgi:hypothetical protein
MDKSLRLYTEYIESQIALLETKKSKQKAEELYYYHIDRLRDFQHERLIHLLVTLFFAGLLVLSIVGMMWIATLNISGMILVSILLLVLGAILFVTVLFYVRHYYRLENGVQRLYSSTEKLRAFMT